MILKKSLSILSCCFTIIFTFQAIAQVSDNAGEPVNNRQRSLEVNEEGVKLIKNRDFIGAEKMFLRALEIDRNNVTAAFNLASVFMQNKNPQKAIDLLLPYVKNNTKDAGIYARIGDAYFVSKQLKESLPNYEKAMAIDANFPGVAAKMATLYTMQGETKKAEELLKKSIEQNPKNSDLYSNLGSVLLANKKPKEAIDAIKKSLSLVPTKEAYITLGNSYKTLRDNQNALIAFKRAKDLGENSPEIDQVINELEEG